jgi:hypothetical protein
MFSVRIMKVILVYVTSEICSHSTLNIAEHNQVTCMSTNLQQKVNSNRPDVKLCSIASYAVPEHFRAQRKALIYTVICQFSLSYCHVVTADWCVKIINLVEKQFVQSY